MDESVHELLQTLREARRAVVAELDQQLNAGLVDVEVLVRLQAAAAELERQTDRLVKMMQDQKAQQVWVQEAVKLRAFFEVTAEEIASVLASEQEEG